MCRSTDGTSSCESCDEATIATSLTIPPSDSWTCIYAHPAPVSRGCLDGLRHDAIEEQKCR
jgi:hypothetical protein